MLLTVKMLFRSVLEGKRQVLWQLAIFSCFINIMALAPSIYMLQVYDRALQSRNEITLLMLTIIIFGILGFTAFLEYIRSMVAIHVSKKIDNELGNRVFTAEFDAQLEKYEGNAGQTLNDVTILRQFFTGNGLFAFFDAPWFPVYISVIFLFNPWLGLLSLAGAVVLIALAVLNEKLSHTPLKEAAHMSRIASQLARTQLRQASVVAAMGMSPALKQRWEIAQGKFIAWQQQASGYNTMVSSTTRFIRLSLQSMVLGLGAWLAIRGELTPGMMIAGSILLARALSPIEQIIGAWRQWKNVQDALERIDKLLIEHPPRQPGLLLPAPQGKLQVENIVGTAPNDGGRRLIDNVSFSLEAGETLGIVGSSGSGKSTIARMLLGIWPLAQGIIRLDNADIHQWARDELGPWIGWLPQESSLFAGTIAENIARFQQPDSEKIIEAARRAGVHELILHLPSGYDTIVGDEGVGLSGGQKQRVALARALYGSPSLVVLDEPDAALDDAGLAALMQTLTKLKQEKITVILITHRKNMLPITDKLLVLSCGKVAKFGPTRQLLAASQAGAKKYDSPSRPTEKEMVPHSAAGPKMTHSQSWSAITKSAAASKTEPTQPHSNQDK